MGRQYWPGDNQRCFIRQNCEETQQMLHNDVHDCLRLVDSTWSETEHLVSSGTHGTASTVVPRPVSTLPPKLCANCMCPADSRMGDERVGEDNLHHSPGVPAYRSLVASQKHSQETGQSQRQKKSKLGEICDLGVTDEHEVEMTIDNLHHAQYANQEWQNITAEFSENRVLKNQNIWVNLTNSSERINTDTFSQRRDVFFQNDLPLRTESSVLPSGDYWLTKAVDLANSQQKLVGLSSGREERMPPLHRRPMPSESPPCPLPRQPSSPSVSTRKPLCPISRHLSSPLPRSPLTRPLDSGASSSSISRSTCLSGRSTPDNDDNIPPTISTYCQVYGLTCTDDLHNIMHSWAQLQHCGFYYPAMTSEEAISDLNNCLVGTFLLRQSSNPQFLITLSFRTSRGSTNVRIAYADGLFHLDCREQSRPRMPTSDSVIGLVQAYVDKWKSGKPGLLHELSGRKDTVIQLVRPRLKSSLSLKHLCRKRLVCLLRRGSFLLPHSSIWGHPLMLKHSLPPVLVEYIMQYPYVV